jgi:hypothetical protein
MSKLLITASLFFTFTTTALASDSRFAQPPPAARTVVASVDRADRAADPMPAGLRIAPRRTPDRATVRAALARARATNLAAFRVYQKKGVFPNNTFTDGKLNVWRDEDGNFCAAATLIKMSGNVDLVVKVADQNNFIRLADVKQGPLMDWILMSGLTQDEIAAIQEPFMPVVDDPIMEPSQPILVDTKLRKAEDARLRAKYKAVDKMIVKNAKKSLDIATDRLMKHPRLAWQLVDSQSIGLEG